MSASILKRKPWNNTSEEGTHVPLCNKTVLGSEVGLTANSFSQTVKMDVLAAGEMFGNVTGKLVPLPAHSRAWRQIHNT